MERATLPRDKPDTTRAQHITSNSSERKTGASLYAFLEGKDVKDAHAEYRSWSSFSPDPVLIRSTSGPGDVRMEFSGLLFKMIKEESGEIIYHFSCRKTSRGWHTRDPWHLELRIHDATGRVVDGLAHGTFDLISIAGVHCVDEGSKISAMNSLAQDVWEVAHAIELTFPSHAIYRC
ncbi:MAG: hypothetical protein GYA24_05515 [Candidatus Lokiarchaeota archaeon]|nr:hypothetical protein [Candidatus Lokiarchaeota archaeon]